MDLTAIPAQKYQDPKIIGQWKVGRTIGRGCSGRVRIARHSKTGQFAAIKIISKSALTSKVSLNRLADEVEREKLAVEREIVVMKLINHPNIMHLYDVWETSTHLYLVLEYIQGGELFDHLCKNGPLPVPEALKYFHQIIGAVDYFHRFNIAHRDLKPENILLDQERNVKIADFGMAAWQIDTRGATGLMKTSCGSPHYAAPEIIRGQPYNGSSADIWSCGVILYALLTTRLPFDDDNLPELLDKVTTGKFTIPPSVDPTAHNLIRRMLTVDVNRRITMAQIFDHPFFKLYKSKAPACAVPELSRIAYPLKSKGYIDPDIFANLRTLWHGASDDELIRSLLNEQKNWQKGIYHLLVNYRANQAAEDEVSENEMERRRKYRARKLAEKRAKEAAAISAVAVPELPEPVTPSASQQYYPPRAEPPTPRKARGRHLIAGNELDSSNSANLSHLMLDVKIPRHALVESTSTIDKLNLNRDLPDIPVSTQQDCDVQTFFEQVVNHLTLLQEKMAITATAANPNQPQDLYKLTHTVERNHEGMLKPTANREKRILCQEKESDQVQRGPRQLVFSLGANTARTKTFADGTDVTTRPLSVKHKSKRVAATYHTAEGKGKTARQDDYTSSLATRKPSLKKRYPTDQNHDDFGHQRGNNHNRQTSQSQTTSRCSQARHSEATGPLRHMLPSTNGSTPKRTWLETIFRFKTSQATRCTLHSFWDLITTRNECRRLLMNMHIHVQVFRDSQDTLSEREQTLPSLGITMKCKVDEMQDSDDILGTLKSTKFRVELKQTSRYPVSLPNWSREESESEDEEEDVQNDYVAVTFIHEKGSGETFRETVRRLKREWTLAGDGAGIGVL